MMQKEVLFLAKEQLAVDLNCRREDFDRPGLQFFPFAALPGRRPFPIREPALELVSFGAGTVVSAAERILPQLQQRLAGMERDQVWAQPFVRSLGHYFLPDLARQQRCRRQIPQGIRLAWTEEQGMKQLYETPGFSNALGYDCNAPRPDVLAVSAWAGDRLVGMAGASADCRMLWQIGVDVVPDWRRKGLAAALVWELSQAVLARGKIPYYGTSSSNLASQRTAWASGYFPAWVCSYGACWDEGE